jgi:CheY-like chemotaxis protein
MPNSLTLELPNLPQAGMQPNGLPLQGVTVLAVEDSRFASEALRLMCRRLGARLRRAESLQAAASHLKLYRPDLVIVDLGLPDGRGEALIAEISVRAPKLVVLGMSGDTGGRGRALAARPTGPPHGPDHRARPRHPAPSPLRMSGQGLPRGPAGAAS